MKNQFVKDLKTGISVESVFLLTKKMIKKKKNGEDYCMVSLQDISGSIDGVIWTETCNNLQILKKGKLEEGDYVKVHGSVSDYKGLRQLDINMISAVSPEEEKEILYKDFVRTAKRDTGEMFTELESFVKNFKNYFLAELLRSFFNDEGFVKDFCFSPAAMQYHHAYIGGLLEHTLSMVKICDVFSKNYENVDRDLLITGAILHDVGKITEYAAEKKGALIRITDKGKLLGHIAIGYGIILNKIENINNFPEDLKNRLLHIILAHHGHKEFGSPKRPKILEAFIVYHADHLDADIGGFNYILENSGGEADWSEYLRNFERSIFLKSTYSIDDAGKNEFTSRTRVNKKPGGLKTGNDKEDKVIKESQYDVEEDIAQPHDTGEGLTSNFDQRQKDTGMGQDELF